MRYTRDGIVGEMNSMMTGLVLEEVEVFKYLETLVTAVGGAEADVHQRVLDASKVLGAVRSVLKGRTMSWWMKNKFYLQVIVPTVTYGAETWGLRGAERRHLNVFEMKFLRPMVGVTIWETIRNDEDRRRTGIDETLAEKVDVTMVWTRGKDRRGSLAKKSQSS